MRLAGESERDYQAGMPWRKANVRAALSAISAPMVGTIHGFDRLGFMACGVTVSGQ